MKAVILAGGRGTRLSEETHLKPKPMVEIGNKPILWHIMKIYSAHGINEFIICLGYKGYLIKEYFANYHLHTSDVTFDFSNHPQKTSVHQSYTDPWRITLVDTGENTMTGGRLKRIREYVKDDDFCFTYGDGLANLNIKDLIAHHHKAGTLATVTATRQPAKFGALELEDNRISRFLEKPQAGSSWVSGGFFVLSPKTLECIDGDDTSWEGYPLESLAQQGQLSAYLHDGFWQPMDTLRDKDYLEDLWNRGKAPWKIWE